MADRLLAGVPTLSRIGRDAIMLNSAGQCVSSTVDGIVLFVYTARRLGPFDHESHNLPEQAQAESPSALPVHLNTHLAGWCNTT